MVTLLVLVVVVGFGIGSWAATLIFSGKEAPRGGGPDAYAWDGTPVRTPITVSDPRGHERWAVQVYRSKAGNPCLQVRRLHRNGDGTTDFGRVDPDGSFHPQEIEDSGTPVDLSKGPHALLINHYPKIATAVIFGMVRGEVKTVTLDLASGTRTLPISGGAYLAALPEGDLRGATMQFTSRDGTSETVRLHWPPPGSQSAPHLPPQ